MSTVNQGEYTIQDLLAQHLVISAEEAEQPTSSKFLLSEGKSMYIVLSALGDEISDSPQPIRDARSHRGRYPQAPVNPAEVVPCEV